MAPVGQRHWLIIYGYLRLPQPFLLEAQYFPLWVDRWLPSTNLVSFVPLVPWAKAGRTATLWCPVQRYRLWHSPFFHHNHKCWALCFFFDTSILSLSTLELSRRALQQALCVSAQALTGTWSNWETSEVRHHFSGPICRIVWRPHYHECCAGNLKVSS